MIEGGHFCEDLQVSEFKELSGKALFLKLKGMSIAKKPHIPMLILNETFHKCYK
jgi:hypothetical protein